MYLIWIRDFVPLCLLEDKLVGCPFVLSPGAMVAEACLVVVATSVVSSCSLFADASMEAIDRFNSRNWLASFSLSLIDS